MTTSNLLATACFALLCLAGVGCQTTNSDDRFKQADADGSDTLSRDEVNEYLIPPVFASRDANRDGKLTKTEWLVDSDAAQERVFRDHDTDRDGAVTLPEALAYARKRGIGKQFVQEADRNKDGVLSRAEVAAFYGSKEGPVN